MNKFQDLTDLMTFIKYNTPWPDRVTEAGSHWSDHYEGRQHICLVIDDEESFDWCKEELKGQFQLCERRDGSQFWTLTGNLYASSFEEVAKTISDGYREWLSCKDNITHWDDESIKAMNDPEDYPDGFDTDFYVGPGYYHGDEQLIADDDVTVTAYNYDVHQYQLCFIIDVDAMVEEEEDEDC